METRKRKALADITNAYNLIPTSELRKLVASSSSNSNSISKPPVSILRSKSSSTNQKLCSDTSNRSDAMSDTSIVSPCISTTRKSRIVQFQTPQRGFSAITPPGELGSKDTVYHRRKTVAKLSHEGKDDVVVATLCPFATSNSKTREKGEVFHHPPSLDETAKYKPSFAKCIPTRSNIKSLPEKPKQKGVENLFGGPKETGTDFGKGILKPSSCSYEKTEKRKIILDLSGCSSAETDEIGKSVGSYPRSLFEKTIDEKKRKMEIGKKVLNSSRSFLEKTKEKEKSLSPFDSPNDKTKEKGKMVLHPFSLDEAAAHKESFGGCLPPRGKSTKRKHDSETSSCPPMPRIKNMKSDLAEAGNTKSSKAYTEPRPKLTKKRCQRIKGLSKEQEDEIKQLKKYFDELNDFKLPVECVSEAELE